MNTATLRELGDLAAAEVAGWNPKELAAAARRAVSLWRHEQPWAAARVRLLQRLPLLPPPPPHAEGAAAAAAAAAGGGGGGGSAVAMQGGGPHGQELRAARAGGATGGTWAVTVEEERPMGQHTPRTASSSSSSSSAVADPAVTVGAAGAGAGGPPQARGAEGSAAAAAAARRRVTGGAFRTALVDKPLRPHELRLAQLVERIVRAANGRLAEGFGSRELASLVWSLAALGYWQQPLLPLAAAFADYGAERLRAADPIAMAMLMQVLAKARAASLAGQPTAARLLELAPASAAAAAVSLPRCLPACEPRTLAGLLHSCAVLLSPGPATGQGQGQGRGQQHLTTTGTTTATTAGGGEHPDAVAAAVAAAVTTHPRAAGQGPGPSLDGPSGHPEEEEEEAEEEGGPLGGRCTEALAVLARDVTRECIRRRFIGFGPAGILTAAGALAALRQVPALGSGGGDGDQAWALLAAAAVSPLAPQMAGASPHQWALLLRVAQLRGCGSSQQMLTAGAISAGALAAAPSSPSPSPSTDHDSEPQSGAVVVGAATAATAAAASS